MSIDVESLRKILELEHKKGYADSAVFGGLDKFLRILLNRHNPFYVQAVELMCDFVRSYSHIEELAVEDATTPADTDLIIERLSSKFPRDRIYRSRPSAVIGTHTGPGLLVVAVLGDK